MRRIALIALIGLVLSGVGCASTSRTSGQKTTEQLVKQVDATSEAVDEAGRQVQTTLANYNAIVNAEAEDPRAAYKQLSKDIDRCASRVETVRKRVAKMKKTAETLFANWATAIGAIDDEALARTARERMETAQQRFDDILASLEKGKAVFEPFLESLSDQVTYLGFNLTPEAIAGLKDQARALNDDAEKLRASIEEAMTDAAEYRAAVVPD